MRACLCALLAAKSTCEHGHVREQELENRCPVTLTDDMEEMGLLLSPWSMRFHKIGRENFVEKERK